MNRYSVCFQRKKGICGRFRHRIGFKTLIAYELREKVLGIRKTKTLADQRVDGKTP